MMDIHHVKLKTRTEMERTIPREKLGWWHDVCPGERLVLRDARDSDLARCCLREGSSRNPADYCANCLSTDRWCSRPLSRT